MDKREKHVMSDKEMRALFEVILWKYGVSPAHKTIIEAMLRGVFDCGHCEHRKTWCLPEEMFGLDMDESETFCYEWQPHKEDGDE